MMFLDVFLKGEELSPDKAWLWKSTSLTSSYYSTKPLQSTVNGLCHFVEMVSPVFLENELKLNTDFKGHYI